MPDNQFASPTADLSDKKPWGESGDPGPGPSSTAASNHVTVVKSSPWTLHALCVLRAPSRMSPDPGWPHTYCVGCRPASTSARGFASPHNSGTGWPRALGVEWSSSGGSRWGLGLGTWPRQGRVHLRVTGPVPFSSSPWPTGCPAAHPQPVPLGQPQLLQFTGQGFAIDTVLGRIGEDETQHCHCGLHIA